jgi:carboxymethylenebutenolidase
MERKKATDFPQELLDLFHLYVHGEIDRGAFLSRAGKFAVGGMTAAGLLAMLKPNYAWAMQVPKDDKRIRTEYANRGLNPYIEDVARRLGTANFIAFAPDGLTPLGGYPGDDEKGGELFAKVDRAKMLEDFVAAAAWLKARPESTGKLGAVGFCFGGSIVNTLAVRMPDLSAAVPFYGAPPAAADVPKIKAAVLAHHAELDTRLASTWPAYDAALTAAGVPHAGYIYPKTNHGFHNDTTPRYDEAAAKLAWQRTLDWFNKYLRA